MGCPFCNHIFRMDQDLREQFNEEHPADRAILAKNWTNGQIDLLMRFHADPPTYAVGLAGVFHCPKCGRELH